MKPKDLRVGTTLRVDGRVTHRYDDYVVVQFRGGTTSKLTANDKPLVVAQPIEPGDRVKKLGYGGVCTFVQYLDDPDWCIIQVVEGEAPVVAPSNTVSLVNIQNPKGLLK